MAAVGGQSGHVAYKSPQHSAPITPAAPDPSDAYSVQHNPAGLAENGEIRN
jgi:hypothetical protein